MKQEHSVTVEELGITISTGSIGRLANGSVTIRKGDTVLFVSATAAEGLRNPDQDFFPLTVDYREKFAAAGRFPGSYFRREGKPSDKEIITSRLCDRPLRPLFPEGFLNEVQVIGLVLSADGENDPDALMVTAASAAVFTSDIPWNGPIAGVRVGRVNGQFVANPTHSQIFESDLNLIYVGNERDMMMIEGEADQISEADFLAALEFGHKAIQPLIKAQRELAAKIGKAKRTFALQLPDAKVVAVCERVAAEGDQLRKAIFIESKAARGNAVKAVMEKAKEACAAEIGATFDARHVKMAFEKLQEKVYRSAILEAGKRADGRGPADLRKISCEVDVLPRVHGSALFQRGETQGLVLATLGTSKDAQEIDAITGGPKTRSFLLHYNFPPFSVGETGRFGMTSRRETGHGNLAERALLSVLPSEQDFPYSIRLVSEIMESNGSTSMASVCGGTLALMDAGVPIKLPVAGISCGLVTDEQGGKIVRHKVLTDIIGAEDHFGDMDFKICGTREGITAFQLDLKIHGLPFSIVREAVAQNKVARDAILGIMEKSMPATRAELKQHTPRTHRVKIPSDKIGALIGPGGKNIKRITEYTGCQIDIDQDDSGWVTIFATDGEKLARAVNEVNLISAQIELEKTYKGIVRSVKEFGVFVECLPGQEGLVHVSELADFRVNRVEDVCKLGDEIIVKCVGIDDKGRVRLSRRAAIAEKEGREYVPAPKPSFGDRPRGDRPDRGERRHSRDRGPSPEGDLG